MSHEIRTPLNAIIGFSDLLKEPSLSTQDRTRHLDTIIRNGQHLSQIIDDILDLAKVEAGRLELEKVPLSLSDLMNSAIEIFRHKALKKGIYIKLSIAPGVPDKIQSDPIRLRQILVNLLGNAVKFTMEGGVTLRVTSMVCAADNLTKIKVEIQDTGCGLSAEQLRRLFQPFIQADNSTTRRYGGTGLGLALSSRLAKALNGDIVASDCALGHGCTFIFSFLASFSAEIPTRLQEQIPISSLNLHNRRILLVDDSTDNQLLIKYYLSATGSVVDCANNGREAIQKASENKYDIVLMDIQMPEMDGFEAIRHLLESGFAAPIVALTAHAMSEDRERTKNAGFAGHLTKPIFRQELLKVLGHYINS